MKHIPQIRSVMTPFPHSVDLNAPLSLASEFMSEHRIRHLPVTAEHKLVGLITDRDLKLILGPDFSIPQAPGEDELRVKDIYIDDPYIVDVREPLDNVLTVMSEKHVGSALVQKKGKLVGVFTVTDVCREFAQYLHQQFRPGGGNEAA